MATIALLIGGAIINALAFSGSNYLFSQLKSSNVDEERQRHDEAVEHLQAAQSDWAKRRTQRLDWLNGQLQREHHAVQTFNDVDAAMREYARVTGNTVNPDPEPQLSDFYTPSDDQKDREYAFIAMGMVATGLAAYKLSKRL